MKKKMKIIAVAIIIICLIGFAWFIQNQNRGRPYISRGRPRSNVCLNCGGSGTIVSVEFPHNTITCPVCNGRGVIGR